MIYKKDRCRQRGKTRTSRQFSLVRRLCVVVTPCGDLLAAHTYTNGDAMASEDYAYDSIGNHVLFSDNLTTNTFSHNQVNQMVGRVVLNAPSTAFAYTPDGGLSSDGTWNYSYDAEDQLTSVISTELKEWMTGDIRGVVFKEIHRACFPNMH